MSKIIGFYRGNNGNVNGDMFEDILTWSNHRLEVDHDYVQFLFPSDEPSMMNADAPVLTKEEAEVFRQDPELKDKVRRAFVRMIDFLGFYVNDEGTLSILESTDKRPNPLAAIWTFNHNMLRVTRVLKSLRLLGHEDLAAALFDALQPWKATTTAKTWGYWERAATRPLEF